jgi:hypothetical protein
MPEALTQYRDTTYVLGTLVAEIGRGAVALPDIQRPFVWSGTQVRNLFDSLYRGFPVGQVMFWETGAQNDSRHIGVDAKVVEFPPLSRQSGFGCQAATAGAVGRVLS